MGDLQHWRSRKKMALYVNQYRSEKLWDVIIHHTFNIKNATKLYYIIKRLKKF